MAARRIQTEPGLNLRHASCLAKRAYFVLRRRLQGVWFPLDIQWGWAQNQHKVSAVLSSFYAQWRVRSGAIAWLREDCDSPPERLLQSVWLHQRLLRDRLRTLDDTPVRVLHPGFLSLEGGPDFRGTVVQFADSPVLTGDVEVDLRPGGWRAHGHDRNPAFRGVILHVTWESEGCVAGAPPVAPLRGLLDAPLGELSLWLGGEGGPPFPEALRGRCCAPLRALGSARLLELLRQAAQVRLAGKAGQFQARARQVGWEQSLWEGLFRALGYKHNLPITQNPILSWKHAWRYGWPLKLASSVADALGFAIENGIHHGGWSGTLFGTILQRLAAGVAARQDAGDHAVKNRLGRAIERSEGRRVARRDARQQRGEIVARRRGFRRLGRLFCAGHRANLGRARLESKTGVPRDARSPLDHEPATRPQPGISTLLMT